MIKIGRMTEIFMENLSEMLECRICLCLLEDPKGLDCQHSYCKDCLDDLLQFNSDGSASLSCVMKCEGTVYIEKDKTTNELSAPYQLKGILDMYKTQASSTPPSKAKYLCRKDEDCNNDASVYCLSCYNLHCSSCRCDHVDHRPSQIPVKFSEKYDQLVPLCVVHNAVAKYICCRTEMICEYCCHRGHVDHQFEKIEVQTKRVKGLISDDEGSSGEIERLRELAKSNYEATKRNAAAIRNDLSQLLRNRTIRYGLEQMTVADRKAQRLLNDFDIAINKHLARYPDVIPSDALNNIDLDENMEVLVRKHVVINEYTRLLANVPTLNIDVTDVADSRPLGRLNMTDGEEICVSHCDASGSVHSDVDRFGLEEEALLLLTQLDSLVEKVKEGEASTDESALYNIFGNLSIMEAEAVEPPSCIIDNSVRPKEYPHQAWAEVPDETGIRPKEYPQAWVEVPDEPEIVASAIFCPMCDRCDITDGTTFINHLVTTHNAVLPGREDITKERLIVEEGHSLVPKEGDRVFAMWGESRWQYFTACIRRFDRDTSKYEIDWDDGDTTGRMVDVEHIALDRIPDESELNIGTVVLFPQGSYHAGATQMTGGSRWHQGVISDISTDTGGVKRYSGRHTKTQVDGKYCTYRGYSHEFFNLTKHDFRLAPNLFDVIQLLPEFFAKEHIHPLQLITNPPGTNWFCHQCVATKNGGRHYQCETCQYDLCLECIKEDLKKDITRRASGI